MRKSIARGLRGTHGAGRWRFANGKQLLALKEIGMNPTKYGASAPGDNLIAFAQTRVESVNATREAVGKSNDAQENEWAHNLAVRAVRKYKDVNCPFTSATKKKMRRAKGVLRTTRAMTLGGRCAAAIGHPRLELSRILRMAGELGRLGGDFGSFRGA